MRTILAYLSAGAGLIAAADFGLYQLLAESELSPRLVFLILLSLTLLLSFTLGCLIHLRLAAEHDEAMQRPDAVEVALLAQPSERVNPIRFNDAEPPASISSTAVFTTPIETGLKLHSAPPEKTTQKQVPTQPASLPAPAKVSTQSTPPFLKKSTTKRSLPMPNPPKTPHPAKAKNLNGAVFQQPSAKLSVPDLIERIYAEGRALTGIIQAAKTRLLEIEQELEETSASAALPLPEAAVHAQKIILALEGRLTRVRQLLTSRDAPALLKAKQLLNQPLTLPTDAVSSLIDSERLPVIEVDRLPKTLDSLLHAAREECTRARTVRA